MKVNSDIPNKDKRHFVTAFYKSLYKVKKYPSPYSADGIFIISFLIMWSNNYLLLAIP